MRNKKIKNGERERVEWRDEGPAGPLGCEGHYYGIGVRHALVTHAHTHTHHPPGAGFGG